MVQFLAPAIGGPGGGDRQARRRAAGCKVELFQYGVLRILIPFHSGREHLQYLPIKRPSPRNCEAPLTRASRAPGDNRCLLVGLLVGGSKAEHSKTYLPRKACCRRGRAGGESGGGRGGGCGVPHPGKRVINPLRDPGSG